MIGSVLAMALWLGGSGSGAEDTGAVSGAAPTWQAAPRPTPSLPGPTRAEPSESKPGKKKTTSPSPRPSRTSGDRPAPSPSRTAGSRTGNGRDDGVKEESGSISVGEVSRTGWERSLRSVNYPDRYVRHRSGGVFLDGVGSSGAARDATFTLVPGLAEGRCHSFRTLDGRYLRHRDFRVVVSGDDGSRTFRQDATFCMRPGAARGSLSFESLNHPGRFLRHRNFELRLDRWEYSWLYWADTSFWITGPLG